MSQVIIAILLLLSTGIFAHDNSEQVSVKLRYKLVQPLLVEREKDSPKKISISIIESYAKSRYEAISKQLEEMTSSEEDYIIYQRLHALLEPFKDGLPASLSEILTSSKDEVLLRKSDAGLYMKLERILNIPAVSMFISPRALRVTNFGGSRLTYIQNILHRTRPFSLDTDNEGNVLVSIPLGVIRAKGFDWHLSTGYYTYNREIDYINVGDVYNSGYLHNNTDHKPYIQYKFSQIRADSKGEVSFKDLELTGKEVGFLPLNADRWQIEKLPKFVVHSEFYKEYNRIGEINGYVSIAPSMFDNNYYKSNIILHANGLIAMSFYPTNVPENQEPQMISYASFVSEPASAAPTSDTTATKKDYALDGFDHAVWSNNLLLIGTKSKDYEFGVFEMNVTFTDKDGLTYTKNIRFAPMKRYPEDVKDKSDLQILADEFTKVSDDNSADESTYAIRSWELVSHYETGRFKFEVQDPKQNSTSSAIYVVTSIPPAIPTGRQPARFDNAGLDEAFRSLKSREPYRP